MQKLTPFQIRTQRLANCKKAIAKKEAVYDQRTGNFIQKLAKAAATDMSPNFSMILELKERRQKDWLEFEKISRQKTELELRTAVSGDRFSSSNAT